MSKQAIAIASIEKMLRKHSNYRIEIMFLTGFRMLPCNQFMVRLTDNWDKEVFQYGEDLSDAIIKAINHSLD